MKRLFYLLAAGAMLLPVISWAWTVPDETLHYEVKYKWGFINANAGVIELNTENVPDSNIFRATLSGKSVNLLGHYYAGEDTIVGTMLADTVQTLYTQHLSKAEGEFDIQTITYRGAANGAKLGKVIKTLPDGSVIRERVSHYGGGVTVDLLGVYYYMRQIDYSRMNVGDTVMVNVVSPKDSETLRVRYLGKTMGDSCGVQVPVNSISLSFISDAPGSQATDMSALITTGPQRLPVYVVGNLKFGHVEARYLDGADPKVNVPEKQAVSASL